MVAPTAVETVTLRGRTGAGINWVGAFLLYSKGATLQEIADQMAIPIAKLKSRFREDDWEGMVRMNRELQLQAPASAVNTTTAIELRDAGKRIEQNREDGLAVLHGLRAHIKKILDAFEAGNVYLPPADIKMLTEAAVKLNAGAMVALGDDPAPKFLPPPGGEAKPDEPDGKKDKRPTMIFNIHLPKVAQAPRPMRTVAPAQQHEGTAVDAVLTPVPPRAAVLEPVAVPSEVVDDGKGRASVNFGQLAANSKPAEKVVTGGVPAFFT